MTAHRRGPAVAERDGIERLVEAEQSWQRSLEVARAEGDRIVAAAEAAAAEAERAFEASIPKLVATRQAELEAAIQSDAHVVIETLTQRARRYAEVRDAVVQELAERIAATAPWICASPIGDDR
jgi:hypothetical protein